MPYQLGAVKPWVQAAAEEVGGRFNIATIGGVGQRPNASDHPKGLALDFMCTKEQGDAIAAYGVANWDRLGLSYIIWEQRIKSSKTGAWVPMEDRGGATANHFDHNHWSFQNRQPTGGGPIVDIFAGVSTSGSGTINGSGGDFDSLLGWVGDSSNWVRVLIVVLGALLLFMGAALLMRSSVTSTIKKVVS